jgi:nitrogen-specific signal transduction histidine kinase
MEEERMVNLRLERMNARLADTNERLRRADKLKDDLLANTSHELRTPLTAILGFSSVLIEEGDEEQSELADAIHRSGQRLLDTVNGLLDMARLQANMLELHPTALDVAEVTQDVLTMLRPLADGKGLYLQLLPEGRSVETITDRYGLERILINLISNAVKFTESGGVTVLLDADDEEVVVTVRDTGIGIEAEFMPHLFDAFKQASTGYGRSHEGSGLGLAIVRRVVELLDGRISVRSQPGEGTTFEVVLPRLHVSSGDGIARVQRRKRLHISAPVLQGARVLVLDSDADTQAVLRDTLDELCTLVFTETTEEALREARSMPFDIVLVAVSSEIVEDRPLVRAFRALPGYGRTPIAALTDGRIDEATLARQGFDQYLVRPPGPDAILVLLETMLTHADAALAG